MTMRQIRSSKKRISADFGLLVQKHESYWNKRIAPQPKHQIGYRWVKKRANFIHFLHLTIHLFFLLRLDNIGFQRKIFSGQYQPEEKYLSTLLNLKTLFGLFSTF
jgi:hypothetical protein